MAIVPKAAAEPRQRSVPVEGMRRIMPREAVSFDSDSYTRLSSVTSAFADLLASGELFGRTSRLRHRVDGPVRVARHGRRLRAVEPVLQEGGQVPARDPRGQ